MSTFVVFEVGRSNVGRNGKRLTAEALCADWNRTLRHEGLTISPGFAHTGNYILRTERRLGTQAATGVLKNSLDGRFAVFVVGDFVKWASQADDTLRRLPATSQDRRATPGVVLDLDPTGGVPPRPQAREFVRFSAFAVPRVRGVWRMDRLRADGQALDRSAREGGWGAIAAAMPHKTGSKWTARSMRTVRGLARRFT